MLKVHRDNTKLLKELQIFTVINNCNVDFNWTHKDTNIQYIIVHSTSSIQLQFKDRLKPTYVGIDLLKDARFRFSYKNEVLLYVKS